MKSHDGVDPQSETTAVMPLPHPVIPPHVVPVEADHEQCSHPRKASKPTRVPMARPCLASRGQPITLLTNHFSVSVQNLDGYFYHYSVHMLFSYVVSLYLYLYLISWLPSDIQSYIFCE